MPAIATLQGMREYVRVRCHRCGHEWVYMGLLIDRGRGLKRARRVGCSQCGISTRLLKEDE